jgi:hypothetical protein
MTTTMMKPIIVPPFPLFHWNCFAVVVAVDLTMATIIVIAMAAVGF